MSETDGRHESRQLQTEEFLQKIPAEQEKQGEGLYCQRISENNRIIADTQKTQMLERILEKDNLNGAYKKVKANKGAGGIDGMGVESLLPHLRKHGNELIQQIREGKYKPNPVRRVEIPKEEKGKVRKLGIPTVVDRLVQQAVAQVLTPIYEKQFSDNSFGFRPGKSQHDALRKCKEYIDDGYVFVVSMDLEKFFDTVNHSKLIEVLSRTIKDGRVISLIHKYLNAGVVAKGLFEATSEGVPQGGPLSPLLGNVMLNELDKELERRQHKFVRFADDCMIFCKSRRAAQRTMDKIIPFIEGKLYLRVNRDKTTIDSITAVKYLGYAFGIKEGKAWFRVHPKSVEKMRKHIRMLTEKNNGWGNETRKTKLKQYITGWINYFKLARMERLMRDTDGWMRRRIRAMYWKQWKLTRTKYRNLRALRIPEKLVHNLANSRKGYWRMAKALNNVLTLDVLHRRLGYTSMLTYYKSVCEN